MAPTIAILGAGPSGLCLARLLELNNIEYCVYERDARADAGIAQGGSLDLHEGTGQTAMQEAGLFDQFKAKARWDVPVRVANMHGEVLLSFAEEGNTRRPEIDRKDLRLMLLESVPEERIDWDHKVQNVERDGTTGLMSIRFNNGTVASGFRLVVGADGAWSKCRQLVTASQPKYSGLHYLTTNLTSESPHFAAATDLVGSGMYMSMGNAKSITAMKLGDGSYYVAAGVTLPEEWQKNNIDLVNDPELLRKTLLESFFADYPAVHTDLIRYSDAPFRDWSLYHMDTAALDWKTVPGVALVGDAAHVSTPFAGRGANESLSDSVQLAQQIVKYGLDNLTKAVEEYEKLMFPRAVDLITESQANGKLLFAQDAPNGFLGIFGAEGGQTEEAK